MLCGSLEGRGVWGENTYMYLYGWVPLLFTWNYYNIVNQLYLSKKWIFLRAYLSNCGHFKRYSAWYFSGTTGIFSWGYLLKMNSEKKIMYWLTESTLKMNQSVQFSRSVVSDSLRPHELQHARPPCPSPTPGVHSDSRPSSQWCHHKQKQLTEEPLSKSKLRLLWCSCQNDHEVRH